MHISFVLDRSGWMQSIAPDVIGGFNAFLATQQADGSDALLTLVQFDSQDPHEVLVDAAAIQSAPMAGPHRWPDGFATLQLQPRPRRIGVAWM